MAARRPLIAGNWKMNGLRADGTALAAALVQRLKKADTARFDMLICPPATLIAPVGQVLEGSILALGGQDCHAAEKGAHTGDISAAMLADLGCRYVIVGHSERRQDHGESDATVRAKAAAAHKAGLIAIVCVGETEGQRDAGEAESVVTGQLKGSIPDGATAENTVIAYEPVWAIGTGRTPTNADIAAMHANIRTSLSGLVASADGVRILYGGSVKPGNAAEILAIDDVDGALVGGASLKDEDFWGIAASCR
ncbi:triose-phosphate isomerase [Indioceanicola profundi]|uniref:triose-phosphate isomerase n=1 Tax=Indioceanicola profundi TaxID=2220096 RepID=UPI000E6A967B|nr:triose-phosphate isomerase [Indioceanicola profundi]